MSNPFKGEAVATLADGRALRLAFDFNALIEAEDALPGESMTEVLAAMARNPGERVRPPRLKVLRALLYGGLRRYHPDHTVADAGDMLGSDSAVLAPAVMAGMGAAFGGPEASGDAEVADDGDADPPLPAGTGTSS